MCVLITGSSGFIGSRLVKLYLDRGYEVVGYDFIAPACAQVGFSFIHASPLRPDLEDVLAAIDPQVVLHCAGSASVSHSLESPYEDFLANVDLLGRVLDGLRINSQKPRFLYFSSAAVYGNPLKLPIREDSELTPISPYGVDKGIGEKLCMMYKRHYGIRTSSIRIFSVYGTGFRRQVIWDLSKKIIEGNEYRLIGTGRETRDFIFISDLLEAIELVLNDPEEQDVYNIGSGIETSIKEVSDILTRVSGIDVPWEFSKKTRAGDPDKWLADISRLRKLGFQPKVDMAEGIRVVYRWALETASRGNEHRKGVI